jgi:hypothetical protein
VSEVYRIVVVALQNRVLELQPFEPGTDELLRPVADRRDLLEEGRGDARGVRLRWWRVKETVFVAFSRGMRTVPAPVVQFLLVQLARRSVAGLSLVRVEDVRTPSLLVPGVHAVALRSASYVIISASTNSRSRQYPNGSIHRDHRTVTTEAKHLWQEQEGA